MKIQFFLPMVISISLLLFLAGCSGSDNNSPVTTTQTGVFIDSPVEGLSYTSATKNGITDAAGTFTYTTNETITFSIGNITLGTASGNTIITPVDLVSGAINETDPIVTNIIRFLQTLDDDGNPGNGITISSDVSNLAATESMDFTLSVSDFENNGNVQTIIANFTAATSAGARMLVTTTQAQAHLNSTLIELLSGSYSGSFSGGDTGIFSMMIDNDGIITGTGLGSDDEKFSITGTVNSDGTAAAGSATTGADFSMNINRNGTISGTWVNATFGVNGSLTGSKN